VKKFAALFDIHYGFERKGGHKVPLHDLKAFGVAYSFLEHFKPEVIILGGDIIDCGVISHHNHGKPGKTEGLKLVADAEGCRAEILAPLRKLKAKRYEYIIGNHEFWLEDLGNAEPGLQGLLDVRNLLELKGFNVIPQGGHTNERNIRFGHFHSYSSYSKNTPMDDEYPKTGISVPCLSKKNPSYGKGKPNRWSQGFLYGYLLPDGNFHDYVVTIIRGKAVIEGKIYRG
jgi:hypothetical protein